MGVKLSNMSIISMLCYRGCTRVAHDMKKEIQHVVLSRMVRYVKCFIRMTFRVIVILRITYFALQNQSTRHMIRNKDHKCTSSKSFGQNRGISKRDSASQKLWCIIHLNGIEMMCTSLV